MKRYSKEFIIGLTAIITLAILFFGVNYLKGINMLKASNYYYASYTNVAGLAQSAPVMLNGYKVGLVREIDYEYDNPGHVRVELSLNKELRVPRDTKAVIVVDMLGTASVELQMSSHPDYHDVGDTLIGETSPGLVDGLSSSLLPTVGSVMEKIDTLLTNLNTIVADPALLSSVKRLDTILANLEKTTAQIQRAVPGMTTDLQATMGNAKMASDNLTAISDNLTEVTAELRKMPLDATMQNIYDVSASLNRMLQQLQSEQSSLGQLMNNPELYNNLNNSAASLDSLLRDVKKNPKRYISIKLL